jgi:hypothetical protein
MRRIRVAALTTALTGLAAVAAAQAPAPPRVSPLATASQVVGLSKVEVTYSRPGVKGRTIWGELVPYDEVWRTGANEATRIILSHDATVEGKPLPAGTYALFTIPGRDRWTVIFNNDEEQWGAFRHNPEHDVLKVTVTPEPAAATELFTIDFPRATDREATLRLAWDRLAVPVRIGFDTVTLAAEKAREAAKDPAQARSLYGWANYFYQQDQHLDEAVGWAAKAAEANPIYWTHALRARLLAKTGQRGEASGAAGQAVELGQKALAESPNPNLERDLKTLQEEMKGWESYGK